MFKPTLSKPGDQQGNKKEMNLGVNRVKITKTDGEIVEEEFTLYQSDSSIFRSF